MPGLVERKLFYFVKVYPPESVGNNTNVTLHFKVEKVSMTRLAKGSRDTVYIGGRGYLIQKTFYTNFKPPAEYRYIEVKRVVSSEDVETQRLDLMPGFRFSWWYSGGEVTPKNRYKDDEHNKQFVR